MTRNDTNDFSDMSYVIMSFQRVNDRWHVSFGIISCDPIMPARIITKCIYKFINNINTDSSNFEIMLIHGLELL